MGLRDISLNHSYISYGSNNIVTSLVAPALLESKIYKRSVGFFSSSVFSKLTQQIVTFVSRNGGRIKLICGVQLSAEDKKAIESGYKQRKQLTEDSFSTCFSDEAEKLSNQNLQLLEELIAKGFMDIKIAITKGAGIYHDKLGIFEDESGDKLVFYGSPNSTGAAYEDNYEKVRVAVSWKDGFDEIVKDEVEEFENLWNGTNPFVDVYKFTEKAHEIIIREYSKRKGVVSEKKGVELRDYQKKAIQAWVDNQFHGFYVMATGTGKTWTAIYSAKILLKIKSCMIVICAPYKHLIKQWKEDLEKVFTEAKIIMVSSENPGWDVQITNEIIANKYDSSRQIIIISTIKSFSTERFERIMDKSKQEKLLIVDEAHRFKNFNLNKDKIRYQYMLGLSATPGNGKNKEFVSDLVNFFGGSNEKVNST